MVEGGTHMRKITQLRIYIHMEVVSRKEQTTIRFAAEELKKYLRKMNPSCLTDLIPVKTGMQLSNNGIWLGWNPEWLTLLPEVADPRLDDAVLIDVQKGRGMITGTNARSVLIAVYRYLRELGCRFFRPGPDGEFIPACDPAEKNVYVKEAASYRHRGCELPYAHQQFAVETLDWLPKVGMNTYFPEGGFSSHKSLECWYNCHGNIERKPVPTTHAEAAAMQSVMEEELALRGIHYHCVGHGWHMDPFGIDFNDYEFGKYEIPEGYRNVCAQINGHRGLYGSAPDRVHPFFTNLCYSKPEVRDTITDAMVQYCIDHPQCTYLHAWLADGTNNHCECQECVKKRPSDWYIILLNELDEKLTKANLDPHIVMLIYVDLLWEPQQHRLNNPDRFTLMFAPITRVYNESFALDPNVDMEAVDAALPPYVRNQLEMPKTVADNIARLRRWQKQIPIDSFDFDYHGYWAHFKDPVGLRISRVMYEDMRGLRDIGINGMVHCQVIRNWMPTGLMNYVMASTLWNRDLNYDDLILQYHLDCFGPDGGQVLAFLQKANALTPTPDTGKGRPDGDPAEQAGRLSSVRGLCEEFMPFVQAHLEERDPARLLSWKYLEYFVEKYLPLSADAYAALYREENEKATEICNKLIDTAREQEDIYPACMDAAILVHTLNGIFRDSKSCNIV